MKSYTDIAQSRKLAEILPGDSADMCWGICNETLKYKTMPYLLPWRDYTAKEHYLPCWSLAALLALLPLPTLEETPITNTETKWQCTIYCDKAKYWSELHDEPIDALIEAILIAKENDNNN